jgi:myo-inositol-1(or 4)-monophosphatase
MAPTEFTAQELDEVYAFAIDLGKQAGEKLLRGVQGRIDGVPADGHGSSNLAFTEKDNAVDIVTQVDEGTYIHPPPVHGYQTQVD